MQGYTDLFLKLCPLRIRKTKKSISSKVHTGISP